MLWLSGATHPRVISIQRPGHIGGWAWHVGHI